MAQNINNLHTEDKYVFINQKVFLLVILKKIQYFHILVLNTQLISSNVPGSLTYIKTINSHDDIKKAHVDLINSDFNINILHVNIIISHVDKSNRSYVDKNYYLMW